MPLLNDADALYLGGQPVGAVMLNGTRVWGTVAPPAIIVAPVVTGTPSVGQVLTCSTGTWSGLPTSYAYQWQEFTGGIWVSLFGATSNTYTPLATMQVRCVVTASNDEGPGDPAASNSVTVTSGSWRTADEWTGTEYEEWSGSTLRQVIDASVIGGAISQLRLRFTNGPYYDLTMLAYVGVGASSGNEYAFDGTPVAVTVGSNTTFSIINDGANFLTATSDDITLSVPSGRNLVVAMFMENGTARPAQEEVQAGWRNYYRLGINDAATEAATGYTTNDTHDAVAVSRLEVFG